MLLNVTTLAERQQILELEHMSTTITHPYHVMYL
jgi:hypothetical protein